MPASSKFPTTIWDGLSGNVFRVPGSLQQPDYHDWEQLIAELTATQIALQGVLSKPSGSILVPNISGPYLLDGKKSVYRFQATGITFVTYPVITSALQDAVFTVTLTSDAASNLVIGPSGGNTFAISGNLVNLANPYSTLTLKAEGTVWVPISQYGT